MIIGIAGQRRRSKQYAVPHFWAAVLPTQIKTNKGVIRRYPIRAAGAEQNTKLHSSATLGKRALKRAKFVVNQRLQFGHWFYQELQSTISVDYDLGGLNLYANFDAGGEDAKLSL